jgi:hypothetical protein
MAKTRKSKNFRRKNKKIVGGLLESNGLPACNNLSIFPVSDSNITNFTRYLALPNDCVINALQIMNAIDEKTANILRVSTLGKPFSKEQIELIFIYALNHNFNFMSFDSYETWIKTIENFLAPGYVAFAGYKGISGHVFLIGRYTNGAILLIDPQINAFCNLLDPECSKYINTYEIKEWYLLNNSTDTLTPEQQQIVIQYTKHITV